MAKPKPKTEDSTDDAVKAFLKKGGKIKKLAPGKAAGYHGKDDPGKDMRGMMDKGDTKAFGTRKKVKSMETAGIGVKVLRKGKEVKPTPKIGVKKIVNLIKPKKTILTNLMSTLDYKYLKKKLPSNIIPAHDGLNFSI